MTAQSPNLNHLTASAARVAKQPDEIRLRSIKSDRWIGYPKAVEAVNRLEDLVTWPLRHRMPNLLIVSPTNNGKTMIIEQFCRRHLRAAGDEQERIEVVSMQMPAVPTLQRFYGALLDELGAPFRPHSRTAELERIAVRVMRETNVRMIIIDELHNILGAGTSTRHEFLNVLRYLGNELRIPLIGVGTRDAYLVLRSDPQLENRFEPFVLPMWTNGAEILPLLASFAKMYPLRKPSHIATPEMAQYLLARSEGSLGELASLLTSAAISAVQSGEESINETSLRQSNYLGPSARRQQFERRAP